MCSTLACALVRSATSGSGFALDFAALAMVVEYDGAGGTVKAGGGFVPRTERSASLAMRSIVQFSGAPQSQGPWGDILGPGSAAGTKSLKPSLPAAAGRPPPWPRR